jgi:hypothetical protein
MSIVVRMIDRYDTCVYKWTVKVMDGVCDLYLPLAHGIVVLEPTG